MPEGDTILRAARTLDKVLAGKTLTAARSTAPRAPAEGLPGLRVERVEARGKNLLVHLSDGRVLHTHMRMTGSWHVYRAGERWQKPARQARFVLETGDWVAVCFNAPVIELLTAAELARHTPLSALGPDVLAPDFDLVEARTRLRARAELEIGEALMDQRALAGIGNVYKSETLFLCGVDPFLPVAALSDRDLDRLVSKARALMAANVSGAPRATRPGLTSAERTWVYGRSRRPCRRCATPIRMRRQGTAARSTYWCPVCQFQGRDEPLRLPDDRETGPA